MKKDNYCGPRPTHPESYCGIPPEYTIDFFKGKESKDFKSLILADAQLFQSKKHFCSFYFERVFYSLEKSPKWEQKTEEFFTLLEEKYLFTVKHQIVTILVELILDLPKNSIYEFLQDFDESRDLFLTLGNFYEE